MIVKSLTQMLCDEQGASATEYSVLILLIVLVALTAISLLGGQVTRAFETFLALFEEASSS